MGVSAGGRENASWRKQGRWEGRKDRREGGIRGAWEVGVGDEGYMECGGEGLRVDG